MLKKVLSVILAVLCIVAVFSGCSDSLSDMSVAQGVEWIKRAIKLRCPCSILI